VQDRQDGEDEFNPAPANLAPPEDEGIEGETRPDFAGEVEADMI